MTEHEKCIEVLKLMEADCHNAPDMFGTHKMVYNAPAIFSYEDNYKQALSYALSLLKRCEVVGIQEVLSNCKSKWVEDKAQAITSYLRGEGKNGN